MSLPVSLFVGGIFQKSWFEFLFWDLKILPAQLSMRVEFIVQSFQKWLKFRNAINLEFF